MANATSADLSVRFIHSLRGELGFTCCPPGSISPSRHTAETPEPRQSFARWAPAANVRLRLFSADGEQVMEKQIGIVGAGTMGRGITEVFARSGYRVTLCDVQPSILEGALETVGRNLDRQRAFKNGWLNIAQRNSIPIHS